MRLIVLGLSIALCACGEEREPTRVEPRSGEPGSGELAADDPRLDDLRLDDLRALGYADVGEPLTDERTGVLAWDRSRTCDGVNLIVNGRLCTASLVTMAGETVHAWAATECGRWDNAILLPDGDLLVVGRDPHGESYEAKRDALYLMRLGWDGEQRWKTRAPVHHDVEVLPSGELLALTLGRRVIRKVSRQHPTSEEALTLFSAEGVELESRSLWALCNSAPERFELQPIAPRMRGGSVEIDLFHSNSLEWVAEHPVLGEGVVLVSIRHQDAVAAFDWETSELVWSFGRGTLSGPHDATVLEDGHLLVFDNGLARGWSRVLEVDPGTDAVVWEYRAQRPESFFTRSHGSNQRLACGNTLIGNSAHGRVFEVTPEGEVVWDYQDPNLTENREPSVLVRARRFAGLTFADLEERVRSGVPLPRVD